MSSASIQHETEGEPERVGGRRFASVSTAARHADLTEHAVRRLIREQRLTGYRPFRGRVLVDLDELDRLILESTQRPEGGRGRASRPHAASRV